MVLNALKKGIGVGILCAMATGSMQKIHPVLAEINFFHTACCLMFIIFAFELAFTKENEET
jgi:hypothetical protein